MDGREVQALAASGRYAGDARPQTLTADARADRALSGAARALGNDIVKCQ